MDNTIRITNLFLGLADGTSEARKENFEELFYDPGNKYEELISSQEKYLVIGRKGTGKTYLANYVVKKAEEQKNQYACIVESTSFLIQKLNNIRLENIDNEVMNAFCKWFLLYQLGKTVIDTHKIKGRLCFFNVHKLSKYIQNFDNDDMYRNIKRISTKGNEFNVGYAKEDPDYGSLDFATKHNKDVSYEAERKAFFEMIPAFERKVFASINGREKYTIIIDDLDELDNSYEDKGEVILGLIKAAREYNLRERNNNIKFVLLLRSEIIDELQYLDANLSKTKISCGVELYWLSDYVGGKQYNHPLMSMIFHKIRASCATYRDYSNEQMYNKLFPEIIDNSKTPLNYLLDHGMGRPRDFVNYLNCAKEMAGDLDSFTASLLKEARKSYSAIFYDEMMNQSAYYGRPEYTTQCMKLLSSLKAKTFSYDDIYSFYTENKSRFELISDVGEALAYLYKLGAIGNIWRNSPNKDFKTGWSYKKEAMNEVDLSKKFTVHYGLRKKFSL